LLRPCAFRRYLDPEVLRRCLSVIAFSLSKVALKQAPLVR
jgi:hypothetical protein